MIQPARSRGERQLPQSYVNESTSNHNILSDDFLMLFQTGALCIHEAAKKGHVGLLKMLLEKGVPVNTKDKVDRIIHSCFL